MDSPLRETLSNVTFASSQAFANEGHTWQHALNVQLLYLLEDLVSEIESLKRDVGQYQNVAR